MGAALLEKAALASASPPEIMSDAVEIDSGSYFFIHNGGVWRCKDGQSIIVSSDAKAWTSRGVSSGAITLCHSARVLR